MLPFNMMQNNPLMQMVNLANGGGNPMALLQQMAGNNPQAAQAMQIVSGKSPQQLRTIAQNMAKERGLDIQQMARELGLR